MFRMAGLLCIASLCVASAVTGSHFMETHVERDAPKKAPSGSEPERIVRMEKLLETFAEEEEQPNDLYDGVSLDAYTHEDEPLKAPTDKENPKCDQACTNGSPQEREACALACVKLQKKICVDGFQCHKGCGNHVRHLEHDEDCEALCDDVHASVCYPLKFEASAEDVSPHHDDKPPPSIEATPAPRIFSGKTIFCNFYPSSYNFEVLVMDAPNNKDADAVTTLGYKQCDEIQLKTDQFVGLRAKGTMAGVSKPIFKIPSIMIFGQWAHGNHQVNFNRYFAKSDGPFVCNGFPHWEKDNDNLGSEIQLYRGGYKAKNLAKLRYKECTPSSLHSGDLLAAEIEGNKAGQYTVAGEPRVVVLGKAGETTALAYEAWSNNEFGTFK